MCSDPEPGHLSALLPLEFPADMSSQLRPLGIPSQGLELSPCLPAPPGRPQGLPKWDPIGASNEVLSDCIRGTHHPRKERPALSPGC